MTEIARTAPLKSRWALSKLRTSGWALILALVVVGFGLVASRSSPVPDRGPLTGGPAQAQQAVEALVSPSPVADALAKMPADFTQVTGVVPGQLAAQDGTVRAVHVDGGCSAPWGDDNTKWDYSVFCKAHDLGYDLLRYADKKGQPLPPAMREALDSRLTADMHAMCGINPMNSRQTCQLVASLYSAGLAVNSWHQRWGPPTGDPLTPMLAGIAVIACLIVFRLSDWLRHRKKHPETVSEVTQDVVNPQQGPLPSWTFLGVGSLVLLVMGESALAVAGWAGVREGWLVPLTWLVQLSPLFLFASGQAAVSGWRGEQKAGNGYRDYLAHRASWALRPALIFVVVALVLPLALELLGIPAGVNATIVRIALHPLWLVGVYLLTTAATPAALWAHRRAGGVTMVSLVSLTVLTELSASWLNSSLPHYLSTLLLALLIQQAVFWFNDRVVSTTHLVVGALAGTAGAIALTTVGGFSPRLIDSFDATPALSAATLPVLAWGTAQVCLLVLLSKPLAKLARKPAAQALTRLVLKAPMSLYLGFLTTMVLFVSVVLLHEKIGGILSWLARPRALMALAILMVPALLVFWWFERNRTPGPRLAGRNPLRFGRLDSILSISAIVLGIGYATIGVFGFALTRLDGDSAISVFGLHADPIQNLVQLLLGVFLLHTVRTGNSAAVSTWVVTAIACVPPLLSALDKPVPDDGIAALHASTAGLALLLAVTTAIAIIRRTKPPAVGLPATESATGRLG
jgi:hypothetical protein